MPRSCRFDAVVRRHGLHWHLIQDLVTSWSALVAEQRRSCRCRVLLVDETSMRKRHRYVTVIVNADTGQVLAMVDDPPWVPRRLSTFE